MKTGFSPYEAVNLTLCTWESDDAVLTKAGYWPYCFYHILNFHNHTMK